MKTAVFVLSWVCIMGCIEWARSANDPMLPVLAAEFVGAITVVAYVMIDMKEEARP